MILYKVTLISCVVSIIGIICSISTLLLIKSLKNWNGYLFIITAMTLCQIVFESSFIFITFSDADDEWTVHASIFLNTFGLIAVTLWTNVLSYIAFRVAKDLKTINVLKYQGIITLSVLIPSLALAVQQPLVNLSSTAKGFITLGIEAFLIALNIIFFVFTYFYVHRVIAKAKSAPNYNTNLLTRARAIRALTYRMGLYPLYQIVSRLMCLWYLGYFCYCDSIGQVRRAGILFHLILC